MQVAASHTALIKRALTSLAAILAVTSIFAVKAAEWEKRAAIEHQQAPKLANAPDGSRS
ncbi:MAG: hypothetical protein KAH44_11700 [Oricola sp.]|jgi:hypothetical protein|nr:hypothetical protein [Oricola sp.]